MDLQLPIKNEFGIGVINSSVEMALENTLKPETLDGDNQYYCIKCAMVPGTLLLFAKTFVFWGNICNCKDS